MKRQDPHEQRYRAGISYLKDGTPRQQHTFRALTALGIFASLQTYTPVLIGTIPLDIDTDTSDLDIACHAPDLDRFAGQVATLYGNHPYFRLRRKEVRGLESVVASFEFEGFAIELFAQSQPVEQQYGYRHMLVEARLLAIGGEAARRAIRELKQNGVKTEPAFAHFFELNGDPYEMLWDLSWLPEETLRKRLSSS
jgi:hypothetical protein